VRVASLWLCLMLLSSMAGQPVLAAPDEGRLVLYLVRQDGGSAGVELQLAGFTLVGSSSKFEIPLETTTWRSDASTPAVSRIAEIEVPAGSYLGFHPRFSSVTAPIGVAPVHPTPPDSLVLPASVGIDEGQTSLWVIDWTPRAVENHDQPYDPGLSARQPSLPPPGGAILVSNEESGSVTLLDRQNLLPRGEIGVGAGARGMAWSRIRQRLYVALASEGAVAVIDLVTHRREQKAVLSAGDEPSRLWMDEEGSRLFVLNVGSSSVSILDAGFLQEVDRFLVEPEPVAFAYDRLREQVYVSSRTRDAVIVYDLGGDHPARRWTVDGGAGELLLSPELDRLFVASVRQRKILVLDTANGAVVTKIDLCSSAKGLALAPLGLEVVASAARCRRISFVIVDGGMETEQVRLPFSPGLMTVDPSSSRIFAVMSEGNGLAVVSTQSRELVDWVPVGRRPYAVLTP